MAISRYSVRIKAKALAQDSGPGDGGTGVQLLLTDPGDYNTAILQALRIFDADRPNRRIVDSILATAGFRQPLAEYMDGMVTVPAMTGLTGADIFIEDFSRMATVWFPYDKTTQGITPLEDDDWRVVKDPAGTFLEFLTMTPAAAETVRLEFTSPHELTEAEDTVADPTVAPTVALANPAAPGNIDNGSHTWNFYYETAQGRTNESTDSTPLVIADKTVNGQADVTVPASGVPGVISTVVTRSKIAGPPGNYIAGTIAGDGGTFRDNLADASLGASVVNSLGINAAGGFNTVKVRDEDALAMLSASFILELAAVKAAQNTGISGLPNDIVDRRTQSDIYRSRSKELRELYNSMTGKTDSKDLKSASAIKDMDLTTSHGWGYLSRYRRQQ